MGVVIVMHMLQVVCCYCGKDMGKKSCDARFAGNTTHGTCKPCDRKLRERLGLPLEDEHTLLEILES